VIWLEIPGQLSLRGNTDEAQGTSFTWPDPARLCAPGSFASSGRLVWGHAVACVSHSSLRTVTNRHLQKNRVCA
jgi:hypothetical protein